MKVAKKIFIVILIAGLVLGSAFLFIPKKSSSSSSSSSTSEQSSSNGGSSSSDTEQNNELVITNGDDTYSSLSVCIDTYLFTQENYSLTVGSLDDSGSFISDNSHFVISDYISNISQHSTFLFYTNGNYSNIITVYLYDSNKTLYDSFSFYPNNVDSETMYVFRTLTSYFDESTGEVIYTCPSYMKFVITKDSSYNIAFDDTGSTAMADITQLYLSSF